MNSKKVLTIQDISCIGQCSLTVALPIISACGFETAVLPSAILSTHTSGFSGYTFRDLTDDMPGICEHWKKENISFDAIYTGYLGSEKQIGYVSNIFDTLANDNAIIVVDPAMADNGKLYPAFDQSYVNAMKPLCEKANYLLPNITEAAFLTDMEYKEEYDESYIKELCSKLTKMGAETVVLTGVSYRENKTGVVVYKDGSYQYYEHDKKAKGCHGTGDVYASAFVGALMNGKDAFTSAKIAADYILECVDCTLKYDNHWYGAMFEPAIPKLIEAINK